MNRSHSLLQTLPLLTFLPVDARSLVLDCFVPVSFGAGECLMREGDASQALYVVEAGQLRVFVDAAGQRYDMGYLGPGDFFGEIAMFKGSKRTASVEAVSPCQLLECSAEQFRALLEQDPDF
jgi:ATP-binding cassette subfamily B protein